MTELPRTLVNNLAIPDSSCQGTVVSNVCNVSGNPKLPKFVSINESINFVTIHHQELQSSSHYAQVYMHPRNHKKKMAMPIWRVINRVVPI